MKMKKIISVFLKATLIIITAVSFYNCSSDNSTYPSLESAKVESTDPLSSATKIVTSEEYSILQASVSDFGNKLKKSFSKLSSSEKKEIHELANKLQTETDSTKIVQIIEKIGKIQNVDMMSQFKNISDKSIELRKFNSVGNVNKKDMLIALEKQKLNRNLRFKVTPAEQGEIDRCKSDCDRLFAVNMGLSGVIGVVGTPVAGSLAALGSMAAYLHDLYDCEHMYD